MGGTGGNDDGSGTDRGDGVPEDGGEGRGALPPIGCDELNARLESRIAELASPGTGEEGDIVAALRRLMPRDLPRIDGNPPDAASARFSPACAMLAGDIDLDGTVDDRDLEALLWAWSAADEVFADLDRDGKVTVEDLARFMAAFAKAADREPEPPPD